MPRFRSRVKTYATRPYSVLLASRIASSSVSKVMYLLFPLYASLFTPVRLRLLGATIGKNVEASTVLLLPSMATVGDGAFLADDTMIASYELGGGWMKIRPSKIGKKAFLGNSGMTGAGRSVPKNSLVAVLSATPAKAKSGTSWLGSPPVGLRRAKMDINESLTFNLPLAPKIYRACWELGHRARSVAAEWVPVGRIRAGSIRCGVRSSGATRSWTPSSKWSPAPWFARAAAGTSRPGVVAARPRAPDRIRPLVRKLLAPRSPPGHPRGEFHLNRGCVVQTHLFHDRVMSIDTVPLEPGATMGPLGVTLPAAGIGAGGTVGPASLVLRLETEPAGTYRIGNPVSPWTGTVPSR
jgi:hypothetical protein